MHFAHPPALREQTNIKHVFAPNRNSGNQKHPFIHGIVHFLHHTGRESREKCPKIVLFEFGTVIA
jgi:hypothetical protein